MLSRLRRSVNQLIRRDLLSGISEPRFICEEGFFTEWKQGNTPKEKPRNPAFGGVFFWLFGSSTNKPRPERGLLVLTQMDASRDPFG